MGLATGVVDSRDQAFGSRKVVAADPGQKVRSRVPPSSKSSDAFEAAWIDVERNGGVVCVCALEVGAQCCLRG